MLEAVPGYQRIVLLNHIISRSTTHAPQEHKPPVHSADELLDIVEKRRQKKWAIEYLGVGRDDDENEDERVSKASNHNFIRLRQSRLDERADRTYAVLLFEYVDQSKSSFPVVDVQTFDGREIEGTRTERGSAAAHVVVRLPDKGAYDDLRYRCAVEAVHSVTRGDIERFLCRQLRRHGTSGAFRYIVAGPPPKGRSKRSTDKEYRYNPRLELIADIGRKLEHVSSEGKILTHMTFTKRGEKESLGRPTEVMHQDVLLDVEYKVSASQGPQGKQERENWVTIIRNVFRNRGFEERLYFRHLKGILLSGEVHKDLAGASDLLMCPRELIFLSKEPKQWHSTIHRETIEQMKDLLDKDELWERSK